MKKIVLLLTLIPLSLFSQNDTNFVSREDLRILSNKVDEIKRDQLNYSLEKNLLKETYSNNFERINLFLTAILGIFGVLTFFGIRDINTIKKEYREELEHLQKLQLEIETKSKEFDASKQKLDTEITQIIQQNEEQNRKIKLLELKDKINALYTGGQYGSALEYCAVALELSPNDTNLLTDKGRTLAKLGRFNEAIETYEKALKIDPSSKDPAINLTELYVFKNHLDKSQKLIDKYPTYFNEDFDGKLFDFFDLFKKYHENDIDGMKSYIKKMIDKDNPNNKSVSWNWDFSDAIIFISAQPESEKKDTLKLILSYLNGQVKNIDISKKLGLDLFDL